MASALINVALSSIRPPHASYYGDINDNNPVVYAANREIKEVIAYFHKKTSGAVKSDEACSRGSNWLFDVWNKYEPRLPVDLFYAKLVEVGNCLRELGVHDVASRQCYQRYLVTRYRELPTAHADNAHSYRKLFFDDQQDMKDHILTSKAILGMYTCEYNCIYKRDPNLLANESAPQCLAILNGIRTFMQCLMVHESLCWMVYNCTILIYQICRVFMTAGMSIKIVEFLLWASMCMETVIPLLGVKYLSWRVTLYSAICLAYYDCKAGHHAEAFARRGLSKLQELSELERLSSSVPDAHTPKIFRQATTKMASMVFKRSVYETRRKPKGYLRPKVRNNLKDSAQMAWPRTVTEKLLSDMFEGSAAQFLGILEALSSSHRRTLHNGPPSTDTDMMEVNSELFFAGKEIIAGGGGNKGVIASGADHSVLAGVQHKYSLMEMAAEGIDGVTISSVVRFIKLAFCYDNWPVFNTLLDCALIYIKKSGDGSGKEGTAEHSGTELCLALLLVMERVAHNQSIKKIQPTTSVSVMPYTGEDDQGPPQTQASTQSVQINDDLVNLAETVLYCINESSLFTPQALDGDVLIDKDMILDASLMLWQKCKTMFGRFPCGSRKDMANALQRTAEPGKWLHILTVVHSALTWCGIGAVDPILMVEVSLRLAMSLEAAASSDNFGSRFSEDIGDGSRLSVYSTTQVSANSQLACALQVLDEGLKSISAGRSNMTSNDAQHVADTSWMAKSEQTSEIYVSSSEAFVRDLHVEMLVVQHRISLRLMEGNVQKQSFHSQPNSVLKSHSRGVATQTPVVLSEDKVKEKVGGSHLSRAIFLMEKADLLQPHDPKAEKLLDKAVASIENAQNEEKRLLEDGWLRLNNPYQNDGDSDVPPPPILLARSDTFMTFKPAPFNPESVKVAWYRVFGRLAAGPNVKVRLNDYYLPGTGDEVPVGKDCILRVDGLSPNQRYVFAVAAYTKDGKLIGGSVGKTGHSFVACHPLSIMAVWGHLAQISHKLGSLKVSKKACSVLWDNFVSSPSDPPTDSWTSTARKDFSLTLYHLNRNVARESSPVLLRHALTSVFVAVETAVHDKEIFCDKMCEKGPLLESQIARLQECERMLVAIEIAGWLNDPSSVLQAVAQTYGLICPIIQAEVTALPVMQVATRCHSALQEIRNVLKVKRSNAATDSLNHMIAVLTNYISMFAKVRGKSQVALAAIEAGKQLIRGEVIVPINRKVSMEQTSSSSKRSKPRKPGNPELSSDRTPASNLELAALEERLIDLTKESRTSDEMLGTEEPNIVVARLSKMRPLVGFRELSKFRRRTRFLEFFVIVLRKALKCHQIEVAIEWSQDVLSSLHRRNEALAVNRAVVSKQPGGVAVQGDETRKYAAAIAEYSQEPKKNRREEAIRSKQREKQKRFTLMKKKSGGTINTEEQEEAERKAMYTFSIHLLRCYKDYIKRRKIRKIVADEIVWRSEFNLLNALLHYQVFLDKVKERNSIRGIRTPKCGTYEFLDQDWWSYETSGAVVVGWEDGSRDIPERKPESRGELNEFKRAIDKAAYLAVSSSLVADAKPLSPMLEERCGSPKTMRTGSTMSHTPDGEAPPPPETFLHPLKVSLLCFRRAMVLAFRAGFWTTLQNAASSLYSSVMVALQMACDNSETAFTLTDLRELVRLPITMAADLLLDMLVRMQNGNPDGDWLHKSFMGEINDEKGGHSLKFEEPLDDAGTVNILLIKRIVFHAIQILHFEERYEKLVDICLRFSELTHDRYCEVISPLVVHAQARIRARVKAMGGEAHPQQHVVEAAQQLGRTHIEVRDYLRYEMKISGPGDSSSIGVGGFIDPESHDVYEGGRRALALSCVPFDPENSMNRLREAFSQSQYMSRALQHARRLLVVYLASQHNSIAKPRKQSAKTESGSGSCVEFSTKADELRPTAPPDIAELDFTSTDIVEVLASPQISTVIEAYNRTLELLVSHGEHELVSQASNEIANLYFHQGNIKAAHRCWAHALDQIFNTKDALHHWKNLIKNEDNIPGELLALGGIWGCLMALSLTCKIGEFTAPNTEMKTDCALLAASLVRAVFRSSMPHPTADCDYASYEIIPTSVQLTMLSQIKSRNPSLPGNIQCGTLLNGIDLFSDRFRCDLHTLVASLHWLCEYLVGNKFCLQALPALTFYQYLATFVCRDTQRSVQCRCLKLTALTELRMFKEASEDALNLLHGIKLPHQSDVAYSPSDPLPINVLFDTKKPIEDNDNLKVLEIIASKRIPGPLSVLYGPHLTCEVSLCQATLLAQLAGCISCIPQKPTLQDLQFVSPDLFAPSRKSSTPPYHSGALRGKRRQSSVVPDDTRSTFSAFSTASSKNVNKLFTKRERPMGLQLLKGMLLAVADNLASNMIKAFESATEDLVASEVWLFSKCLCLMSEINQQRQLSTISAAKAMSALKVLRDSAVLKEEAKDKPRKLRSALRLKRMASSAEGGVTYEPVFEPFPVLEQMYRTRLCSRLWLDCRLRLCQALATQIKGLGKVESALSDQTGLLDHSQAQLYCAEGLAEAEACNDVEMQALFLIQGATLDGISSSEGRHMLEDAASSLDEQEELSCRAIIGLVESTTMMADLCLAGGAESDSLQMYKSAHSVLLLKMMQEGETIQHFQAGSELSSLSENPKNLCSRNLQLLAHIKLRIAHRASQALAMDRIGSEHATVAQLLSQAQKLSSASVVSDAQLLAEIHLEYGKIQRSLLSAGIGYIKPILSCLQEAINLSLHEASDLSTVKNAYLEMAMADLVNIERKFSESSFASLDPDRSSSSPSLHGASSMHETGVRSFSMDVGIVSQPLELTLGKGRVAQSLYLAYHAACGLQQRALLPGNSQVTTLTFTPEDKSALPDFVLVDLSSDHTDLPPASSSDDFTQDQVLGAVRTSSTGLSWIHVLMYNILLLRKSRLSTLISNETSSDEEEPARSLSESEESVLQGSTSHVRTPLKGLDVHLRMSVLHMYLKRHTTYAATCVSPPLPKSKSFVAAQWHKTTNVQLLWAVSRSDGTTDCGRATVGSQDLDNISQQVVDLKKRTDEFFGRSENQQETSQTQRRRTKPKLFAFDSQLEEDWKHIISQINNLIASQDDLVTQLPFEITLTTSKSVVDLFSVGCCFDNTHPLHKWMSDLLCPC